MNQPNDLPNGHHQHQTPCPRCGGTGFIPDDRTLGAAFRVRRKAEGISLRDMAGRMQISSSYLVDLEFGRRPWSIRLQERYQAGLEGREGGA